MAFAGSGALWYGMAIGPIRRESRELSNEIFLGGLSAKQWPRPNPAGPLSLNLTVRFSNVQSITRTWSSPFMT